MIRKTLQIIFLSFIMSLSAFFLITQAQEKQSSISTEFESAINKVAPGEFLPLSIKLVNFGSARRVDVTIHYQIVDSVGKEVYFENETVAVDTTASFVKRILLPRDLKPGLYTVMSDIQYPNQETPAVSKFQFTIERKIGGFFVDDLIAYSIVAVLLVPALTFFVYSFARRRSSAKIMLHDYSDKPKQERIYYEILSDIIQDMRLRIGDDALAITENIPNLQINPSNGLIIYIGDDPAKVIALIIHRYEKLTGQRVSFGLRKHSNSNG